MRTLKRRTPKRRTPKRRSPRHGGSGSNEVAKKIKRQVLRFEHEDYPEKETAKRGAPKLQLENSESKLRKLQQHVIKKWRDVAKEECQNVMNSDDAQMCIYCIEQLGRKNVFDLDDWNARDTYLQEDANYYRLKDCVDELKRYGVW